MIEETMAGQAQGGIPTPKPKVQAGEESLFDNLIYETFRTDTGRQLIKLLEERFVRQLTWRPGCPEGYAEFRAGQNDLVVYFIKILEAGLQGKLNKGGDNE